MIFFLRNKQPLCKHECMNAWSFRRQVMTAVVEVIVFLWILRFALNDGGLSLPPWHNI